MATRIRTITGDAMARWGVRGCDLGYTAKTNHGYCISIFGDAFESPMPGGPGWRSPVGFRQHNPDTVTAGARWDNAIGGGYAKQMITYDRQPEGDTTARDGFTQIPCDLIHLPDGRYLMTTFMVREWGPHGMCSTWGSRMWTSTETHAENWERTWNLDTNRLNMDFWNSGNFAFFQNNSMILWDNHVYIFGTRQGRSSNGIYLMRVPWDQMWRPSQYRFWHYNGSQWVWSTNTPTAILHSLTGTATLGEINAQVIAGRVYLAYTDSGFSIVRSAATPHTPWTGPKVILNPWDQPSPYAPVIHPYSAPGDAAVFVSEWSQGFYGVHQYRDSLEAPAPAALEDSQLSENLAEMPVGERAARLADTCEGVTTTDVADAIREFEDKESQK